MGKFPILRANRRSFDCASRDEAARGSAQDDNFCMNPSIHQSINPSIHQSINPAIHEPEDMSVPIGRW
jgi:hypothetical protein